MARSELAGPISDHTTSAAARQKTGMPMAIGNNAAFHGQPLAAYTAKPEQTMMAAASASDALLCMSGAPLGPRAPRLDERVADHRDRQRDQHQHDGPRQPRGLIARHRDIEVVLRDLAEHQPQHEGRPRPAADHHEPAYRAEHEHHEDVAIMVVSGVGADEDQDHDYGDQ